MAASASARLVLAFLRCLRPVSTSSMRTVYTLIAKLQCLCFCAYCSTVASKAPTPRSGGPSSGNHRKTDQIAVVGAGGARPFGPRGRVGRDHPGDRSAHALGEVG